jgi:hypothetical protein
MDLRERTAWTHQWLETIARFRWPLLLLGVIFLGGISWQMQGLLRPMHQVLRTDLALGGMGLMGVATDPSAWLFWAPALLALLGAAWAQWRVLILWPLMVLALGILVLAPVPAWTWALLLLCSFPLAGLHVRLAAAWTAMGAICTGAFVVGYALWTTQLESLTESGWMVLGWAPVLAAILVLPLGTLSARLLATPRRQAWAESWTSWANVARNGGIGWLVGIVLVLLLEPSVRWSVFSAGIWAFLVLLPLALGILPAWTCVLPWKQGKTGIFKPQSGRAGYSLRQRLRDRGDH